MNRPYAAALVAFRPFLFYGQSEDCPYAGPQGTADPGPGTVTTVPYGGITTNPHHAHPVRHPTRPAKRCRKLAIKNCLA